MVAVSMRSSRSVELPWSEVFSKSVMVWRLSDVKAASMILLSLFAIKMLADWMTVRARRQANL